MVSLPVPLLTALSGLLQTLPADHPQHAALHQALGAFTSPSLSPDPVDEAHALQTVLAQLEKDPERQKDARRLGQQCVDVLQDSLKDKDVAAVEMRVNDPEGERILEEMEEQTSDLHLDLAPLDDNSSPVDPVEPPRAATPVATDSPGFALPSELLPLLLSAPLPPRAPSLSSSALLVTLSLQPSLVLLPGKSLLSLIARPPSDERKRKRQRNLDELAMDSLGKRGKGMEGQTVGMSMEERVGVMMKSAFWDHTVDMLLSPSESKLKQVQLQTDLVQAAETLLTPSTLADVFPVPKEDACWEPKEFAGRLDRMLVQLKAACAPVRDSELDRLRALLNLSPAQTRPSSPSVDEDALPASNSTGRAEEDTRRVIRVVQGVLEACDVMKSDLSQARLASIPTSAIPSLVRALAQATEKDEVLGLRSMDDLRMSWKQWAVDSWTKMLVESVCSSKPLTFDARPSPDQPSVEGPSSASKSVDNKLPPILNAVAPVLWLAQNLVQSILITSSLLLLCPSPTSSDRSKEILDLLRADLLAPPGEEHVHLSDLQSIVSQGQTLDDEGTKILKSRIEKILRTEDPVWGLLVGRLEMVLTSALEKQQVPSSMQTGVVGRSTTEGGVKRLSIKGFEGEVLEETVGEVLDLLQKVQGWVSETWAVVLKN